MLLGRKKKKREVVKHAIEIGGGEEETATPEPAHSDKIGRNELCSCGSGKSIKSATARKIKNMIWQDWVFE